MTPLPIKMVRINYIYCFRFINMPPGLLTNIVKKTPIDLLEKTKRIGKKFGFEGLEDFEMIRPNSMEGFQSYLQMDTESVITSTKDLSFSDYTKKGERAVNELPLVFIVDLNKEPDEKLDIHGWPATLSRSITMAENGTGIYCLTLILTDAKKHKDPAKRGDNLNLSRFLQILNIAEKGGKSDRRFALIGKDKWGNDKLNKKNAAPMVAWASRDINNFRACLASFCGETIRWLCRDGDGVIFNRDFEYGLERNKQLLAQESWKKGGWSKIGNYPSQNPYVFTEIEAKDLHSYMELISSDHRNCYHECLRGVLQDILLRVGPSFLGHWKLNSGYLHRHGADLRNDNFPNYHPTNYLFINAHFRSTMVLIPPLNDPKTKKVEKAINQYILALRDTVYLIRSRWFYLVTEHAYVDSLVKHLDNTWKIGKNITSEFYLVQQQLLIVRFNIGKMMESPIVYRRAASSLNELYYNLMEAFKIESVQTELSDKLKRILDIYNECLRIQLSKSDDDPDFTNFFK